MIQATPGFLFITPIKQESSFIIPDMTGVLRVGIVQSVGGAIYHASGLEIESPVKLNDKVVFQYYEDEDFKDQGLEGYLVNFNRIVGVIHE